MMDGVPAHEPVQDEKGRLNHHWQTFFSKVFTAINVTQESGTTAQRPVKGLFIGRSYFDTTLEIPVWYNGTNWVNATGSTV